MDLSPSRKPLLYETAAAWCLNKLRENKIPLLSAIIVGLLSYTFAFTNKFINHDEAYNLFGKGATLDSGRWGLALLDTVLPNYSMPWLYGILTIVLLALSSAVVVRILKIRSKPLQVLLAASIVAFPSLIGTFAFMFTSSAYGISFLLSVLSVLLVQKKQWYCRITAVGFLVFSVSIYQSYISVAASLLVLVLIRSLLLGDDVKDVVRRGFGYVGFLAVSLGLYFLLMKLSLLVIGKVLNEYSSNRVIFRVQDLPANLYVAYQQFLQLFTLRRHGLIPTISSCRIHVCALILAGLLLILWAIGRKERSIGRLLLLAALIAILPAAINCIYLFTARGGIHTLVLYGFVAVYFFLILIADICGQMYLPRKVPDGFRRFLVNGVVLCLSLIISMNIYLANISFLSLHLKCETTYSFYTGLIAEMRATPEFDENTKLAVIGRWPQPEYYDRYLYFLYPIFGINQADPDIYSREYFLRYYLSLDIPIASFSEEQVIQKTEEYQNMPVYPYYGSTKMFGDIFVVKLS